MEKKNRRTGEQASTSGMMTPSKMGQGQAGRWADGQRAEGHRCRDAEMQRCRTEGAELREQN